MSKENFEGHAQFMDYVASYGKQYTSSNEWERRAQLFIKNDKIIREWNSKGS